MSTDFFGLSDDSAMVQRTSAKVEQEGKAQARCREIMHGLCMVTSAKLGGGFDLTNNFTVDYQIGFKHANFDIFVVTGSLTFRSKEIFRKVNSLSNAVW